MGAGIIDTLSLLGFISIIFSVVYYVKNRKNEYSKKIFYSTLIGGLIFFSIGIGFSDTGTQDKLDEALEQNEILSSNINVLESDKEELKKSLTEIKSDYEEQISDLESELEDVEKEIEKYEHELASLNDQEEEIDNLNQRIGELEKENEELKSEINRLEASASTSKTTSTASTSSTSSSKASESSLSSSSTKTTDTASVTSEDCNIKGSESGIYHVPGSTYYDRTKNVAQWFCSTDEAIAAGYRAPKR